MEALLLILVLHADPGAEATAKMVAEELVTRGGSQVRVVVGAEAFKELEKKGLRDGDLTATPRLAEHLTKQEGNLIVIRLEQREAGGDRMVETRIWNAGHCERHTAIAGKGGSATPGAIAGVIEVLNQRLPASSVPANDQGIDLPVLVQRQAWAELVERLAKKPDRSLRESYYLVLAQVRLRDPAAKQTVAAMAKDQPEHFMVKAAEALLPAEAEPAVKETPLDK